jgi:hypothetical protein
MDSSGSGYGQVEISCEHGNKFSGTVECWEFLEQLEGLGISQEGLSYMQLQNFQSLPLLNTKQDDKRSRFKR